MPKFEVLTVEEAANKYSPETLQKLGLLAPPGESKAIWVSPLDVLFSQNVIYPRFADGGDIDEVVKQIQVKDGEDDRAILEPPFPKIEVVRWTPKLRAGDGKPLEDEESNQRQGVEGLFTLDNRRLYSLQRAAVRAWPRKCLVEVLLLDRQEAVKHLKKFRTRTAGLSVMLSECNGVGRDNTKDFSAIKSWCWHSEVAGGSKPLSGEGQSQPKADGGDDEHGEGGGGGGGAASARNDSGQRGCWEYLDPQGTSRGPFSNWQMRQWWERKMLPETLKIRAYLPGASSSSDDPSGSSLKAPFRGVKEVFEAAPSAFAPGWSPRQEVENREWKDCAECLRPRLEGWEAYGKWYCTTCWKKWQKSS